MKRSTQTLIALSALAFTACVHATASDTVTKSVSVSFPGVPVPPGVVPAGTDITVSDSTTIDLSQALKNLAKVGTVSLDLPVNTLSDGNLSFVKHMRLSMAPQDGSLPSYTIADFDVPNSTTNVINIPVNDDPSTLENYFSEGPEVLTFTLSCDAAQAVDAGATNGITVMYTVEAAASININKSVSDIGH